MKLMDELIEAYLNGNDEVFYMFNENTKEVTVGQAGEEADLLKEIPQMTSTEAYDLMVQFAKEQAREISSQLVDALNGKQPFESFKDQIKGREIEKEWYEFENQYAKSKMSDWLEQNS